MKKKISRTCADKNITTVSTAETNTYYKDLDSFFGSWIADLKTDQALAEQRKVDK
jgi:hypothetical protein